MLYYAGHGIETGGQNSSDTGGCKPAACGRTWNSETASSAEVLSAVDGAHGLRLVILDACRDNPFRARVFGTRDSSRGLRAGRTVGEYLRSRTPQSTERLLWTYWRPQPLCHGPRNTRPGLEIVDLFREVKDDVLQATGAAAGASSLRLAGAAQGLSQAAALRRAPSRSPPRARIRPVDDRTIEHTRWMSLQQGTSISDLEVFMTRFPNREYCPRCEAADPNLRIETCGDADRLERFIARKRRLCSRGWIFVLVLRCPPRKLPAHMRDVNSAFRSYGVGYRFRHLHSAAHFC